MPHADCIDFYTGLVPGVTIQMLELHVRLDRFKRDREINRAHLSGDQSANVDVSLFRTVHTQTRFCAVQRREERQSLDVIPVEVRKKQFCAHRFAALDEMLAEKTNAAAGVENETTSLRFYLNARRVAAESCRGHSWTRH